MNIELRRRAEYGVEAAQATGALDLSTISQFLNLFLNLMIVMMFIQLFMQAMTSITRTIGGTVGGGGAI